MCVMQKEIWKEVSGFGNRYLVSNMGRVKSNDMLVNNHHGTKSKKKGRVLKPNPDGKKYLCVKLCYNGTQKTVKVHRLVANAFVDNPENKPQVNHINGIKSDNKYSNLEWCTNSENQIHAVKNKLVNHVKGASHHNSKFTKTDVLNIRKRIKLGDSCSLIARDYGVSVTAIYYIKHGINWGHV